MAQRILEVFEGTRDSLDSSDDEMEPALKRAKKATINRAHELRNIMAFCKKLDPTNRDHLTRLEYHAQELERNARHGYFKWGPPRVNKVTFSVRNLQPEAYIDIMRACVRACVCGRAGSV